MERASETLIVEGLCLLIVQMQREGPRENRRGNTGYSDHISAQTAAGITGTYRGKGPDSGPTDLDQTLLYH